MKITAYVLLFGFLFQPLIVYWSSPWFFDNTITGVTEVTCALKGKSSHDLQTSYLPVEKLAKDKHCPALKLVNMANSTLHFAVPVYQSHTLYLIDLVDHTTEHQYLFFHYNAYSTRAPPYIS